MQSYVFRKSMWIRLATLISGIMICAGCTAASIQMDELKLVVPEGAYDIRTDQLGHPAVTQVSFKVNLEYPAKALTEVQMRTLKERGWFECRAQKREWDSYRDLATQPNQRVFEYERSFLKDKKFLTVTMMYLSDFTSNSNRPDNIIQRVVAISYDLTLPEVRAQMDDFVKRCKPGA